MIELKSILSETTPQRPPLCDTTPYTRGSYGSLGPSAALLLGYGCALEPLCVCLFPRKIRSGGPAAPELAPTRHRGDMASEAIMEGKHAL
jgi:hypothetical protein